MPAEPNRRASWLVTDEGHRIGSGWISGTIGAVLGLASLATVSCLWLPEHLTMPALRGSYPQPLVRGLLHGGLGLGFALGVVSLNLRRKKTLGLVAVAGTLLAGGLLALAPERAPSTTTVGLGLDVFVLDLLLYTLLFVPLERLWPRHPEQPTFRPEWWTDLAWFFSSALLIQLTTFMVLAPAHSLSFVAASSVQGALRSLPVVLQFVLIVVIADVVQFQVHRACHRVPWLWRFHAIHHSATAMDWLAGSRLHIVDALLTRALIYLPLFLLGFEPAAIAAYLVFVAAQATFVHANVGWRLGWLERWLTTPRFHHWHHADEPADVNFAVHLPVLDRLFGTWHLPPGQWPARYGLAHGVRALGIANTPSLAGAVVNLQMIPFELDAAGNLIDVTATNALALTVGHF